MKRFDLSYILYYVVWILAIGSVIKAVKAIIRFVKVKLENRKKRKELEARKSELDKLSRSKPNRATPNRAEANIARLEQIKKQIEENEKKGDEFMNETRRLLDSTKRILGE